MVDVAKIKILFGITMENVNFFYILILKIIPNPSNIKGLKG